MQYSDAAELYLKAEAVIRSCKTKPQLIVASRFLIQVSIVTTKFRGLEGRESELFRLLTEKMFDKAVVS